MSNIFFPSVLYVSYSAAAATTTTYHSLKRCNHEKNKQQRRKRHVIQQLFPTMIIQFSIIMAVTKTTLASSSSWGNVMHSSCTYHNIKTSSRSSLSSSLFAFASYSKRQLTQQRRHSWAMTSGCSESMHNHHPSSSSSTPASEAAQLKKDKYDRSEHIGSSNSMMGRRKATSTFALASLIATSTLSPSSASAMPTTTTTDTTQKQEALTNNNPLQIITDPNTYSSLVYIPPPSNNRSSKEPLPVIFYLHGAGQNKLPITNLANPTGEHGGLLPSLIASKSNEVPSSLLENFIVVCPYAQDKRSFYEEPRSKLLSFMEWFMTDGIKQAQQTRDDENKSSSSSTPPIEINRNKLFLFGFSDGATVSIELLTTRKFAGAIIAAYGYSGGVLPARALERLQRIPLWVFHCKEDVIFDVKFSDLLVQSLRKVNGENGEELIRYTRYDRDQEGFTGRVKGHSVGITASKKKEVYDWLLSL
uniref:Phospholipase/carboxylesterase/thioesterase domain-containing protein n=1 Tax=Ditylum brightwellii TaxID=49249 RepID=A0A7S1ZPN4_9STRA|mmetsp:Transcript_36348/g.54260  ORF Transcript_36348/g.54260 Transcript_36348/m.54260 type:complete len:474 (+) Transcript_36348:105-1526(+)